MGITHPRPITSSEEKRMKTFGKYLLGAASALLTLLVTATAWAQESGATSFNDRDKWIALAAGLGIGVAAFGGSIGQGIAAGSALNGIARNPGASDKIFTPMILGLALIESLVIYALVIAIMLYLKIH
jgi:F-type H+-transporting ATPase subunit c